MCDICFHVWPKLHYNIAKQNEKRSHFLTYNLKVSNSTTSHHCSSLLCHSSFLFIKKYWQLWPHINSTGQKSCRKWSFLMFHHDMAQLEYLSVTLLYSCLQSAAGGIKHLSWWVTPIAIWSLITSITRHNRFKFSESSRLLQQDYCDEFPGPPSPGSQRCNCACHCIDGLHRTTLHIDTQILQVETKYELWD